MSYLVYISWLEREFDPSYPINSSNSYDSPLDPNRSLDQSSIIGGDEGMNTKQFFPTSTVLITCDGKNPSGAISSINNPLDRQISGVFVCPDPTQGHVQLVRYSDGYLAAVNITIQRKLLQLEGRIKV